MDEGLPERGALLSWSRVLDGLRGRLRLSPPTVGRTPEGSWRVSWRAGDETVWFESDHELAPSAEAAVAAFQLPGMKRGGGLAIDAPLDPTFALGIDTFRRAACEHLGLRGGEVDHAGLAPGSGGRGTGVFFSGGVDSFFSLRAHLPGATHLIFVEGFDVDLDDRPRLDAVSALVASVAASQGLGVTTVRTNLRRLRAFSRLSFVATNGSALAAVGHLLRSHHDTVVLGSDGVATAVTALAAQADSARSSSALRVVRHGGVATRLDKVRSLVDWPLVMANLRVCWVNTTPTLNCGVCEKCLRTRTAFIAAGFTDELPTMPRTALPAGIDALAPGGPITTYWADLLPHLPDGPVLAAAERFVRRCRALPPDTGLRRFVRKARRALARLRTRTGI